MNRFLLILILTLSYQSLTKAEDISDFQIEEMSIGDNLLTHVNLKIIKNSRKYTYKSNKFYSMDLILDKFNTYYAVQVHLKKDDKKYQIYGLSGAIKFGKAGIYYPKSKDEGNKLDKTSKIIDNVKQLYRKDIEQFYPELAA